MLRPYWKYLMYILDHKVNVLVECWKEGLYIQGIIHDWSKFLPQEFFPYARRFYKEINEKTELEWKYAWLHHQHKNKHHWNYWVVNQQTKEALPMPKKYVIEMYCDWKAFSRKWGRKVKEPKITITDKIILHPLTRSELERLIDKDAP